MQPRRLRFAAFASQPGAADASVGGDNQATIDVGDTKYPPDRFRRVTISAGRDSTKTNRVDSRAFLGADTGGGIEPFRLRSDYSVRLRIFFAHFLELFVYRR
jgi:hypothetical protein